MKSYAMTIKKPESRQTSCESKLPPISTKEAEESIDLKLLEQRHEADVKAIGIIRKQLGIDN